MPIKVYTSCIKADEIRQILQYYNDNKPKESASLAYLNCKEGGFKLDIPIDEYLKKYKQYGSISGGISKKPIKQLRWNNNILVSYYNYPGFSPDEEFRLYRAISSVLGHETVKYYETFSNAILSSPAVRIRSSPVICRNRSNENLSRTISAQEIGISGEKISYSPSSTNIWTKPRIRL